MEGFDIGLDQLCLALELLADQDLDHLDVDIEEGRKRADIDDVLEELAKPGFLVALVADLGERDAERLDVVPEFAGRQRFGIVVEDVAALDRLTFDRGELNAGAGPRILRSKRLLGTCLRLQETNVREGESHGVLDGNSRQPVDRHGNGFVKYRRGARHRF
jgi:hypothetical protein